MLQIHNLAKSFGQKEILKNFNLTLSKNEKLGILGRNGQGKSTLLKLIIGDLSCDEGSITIAKNYSLGYLRQQLAFDKKDILEEVLSALLPEQREQDYRAKALLSGLGFSQRDFSKDPHEFSGGMQLRIELAKVLCQSPDLLILDEPTNYLDIVTVRWLIGLLRQYPGELLIVSHDRSFLSQVTTHSLLLRRLYYKKIKGDPDSLYQLVKQEDEINLKTKMGEDKKKKEIIDFANRFRAKSSKAKQVQSRLKMLDKWEDSAVIEDESSLRFSFVESQLESKNLLSCQGLGHRFDKEFLFKNLSLDIKKGFQTAIIGKNGKGKSTLLRILAKKLTPSQGQLRRHPKLMTAHFDQMNRKLLNDQLSIIEEIMTAKEQLTLAQARALAGMMLFSNDDALKKIKVLSGGEKSRVQLAKIIAQEADLIMLDEPDRHLDYESIESLLKALINFNGAVVLVSHNEYLLDQFATSLIIFNKNETRFFDGPYQDFLQREGWEDKENETASNKADKSLTKKEIRDLREAIIRRRAQNIRPLQSKMGALEKKIAQLEDLSQTYETELIEMSKGDNTDSKDFARLGSGLKKTQSELELCYSELFSLSEELEIMEQKYKDELEDI